MPSSEHCITCFVIFTNVNVLGMITGAASGILRSIVVDSKCRADIIPVDVVINLVRSILENLNWRLSTFIAHWNIIVPTAVWPDMAKFCHFGTMLKHFGHFECVHLVFAKILSLFWQICYAIEQIFICINSQVLNK